MRKTLAFVAIFSLVVAVVAMAAPDPWRVKVSDFDPIAPTRVVASMCDDEPQAFSLIREAGWGANGGPFSVYYGDSAGSVQRNISSFNATNGAISWGTDNAVSVEGLGTQTTWGNMHALNVLKLSSSSYKAWNGLSSWVYNPTDLAYMTSTDGLNWTAPTQITVAGSCALNTGDYAHACYLSTGGVYLSSHKNSMAFYGSTFPAIGLATSDIGETVWYDIDTNDASGGLSNSFGDPLCDADLPGDMYGAGGVYPNGKGDFARACDGNMMLMYACMDISQQTTPYNGPWRVDTTALVVGTAGELTGADEYVFICDPSSNSTQANIFNTPFSTTTTPGLSGPTTRISPPSWGNDLYLPLGLKANKTDPATKFMVLYQSWYDTDSDGTPETQGFGRGLMSVTRNRADLNYDGTVNFQDIGPFSGAYGSTSGTPGSLYNADADFNADGVIDFKDIGPLSGRYGSDCSYSAP